MGQSHNCSGGRRRPNPLGSHCHGLVQHWLPAVVSDWMNCSYEHKTPTMGGSMTSALRRTA